MKLYGATVIGRLPRLHIINAICIINDCFCSYPMIEYITRATVLQGGLTSILHRMGVMLMNRKRKNKKLFDFKDLMAFGSFILALLTFIYLICH